MGRNRKDGTPGAKPRHYKRRDIVRRPRMRDDDRPTRPMWHYLAGFLAGYFFIWLIVRLTGWRSLSEKDDALMMPTMKSFEKLTDVVNHNAEAVNTVCEQLEKRIVLLERLNRGEIVAPLQS